MFFKRIEMVGFKSFATKTVCEFIPGTTVIVGPNGCGKSNLLDAIKWVFGEQSAYQLRGKRMADVIFAGSASFKSLGMAQVSITVDNSRRVLPMDFEEVQVTRRLYRSGESEYLINKIPCRLRDVHDLFLGTGMGKSAYSILEQGRVDQIINTKPIDRRYLIEEAAGISKFRQRKLETLRKLERTDTDLSRLNDLISEIERQVRSLKRQAGKAERYRKTETECRQAEQELMVLRTGDLRSKTATMKERIATQKNALAALRAELATKSAAEEQAHGRQTELADRIQERQQALFDLKSNTAAGEHQITRLNDQLATHAGRIAQIEGEVKEMEVRSNEVALRLDEVRQRKHDAEEARGKGQERFERMQAEYAKLEEDVRRRTGQIEELVAEVNTLREAVARADHEIQMTQALIERQTQAREEAASGLQELETTRESQAARCAELVREIESADREIQQRQDELAKARAAQSERREQLDKLTKQLEQLRGQLHAARSRLQTLTELKAAYEGYYQGVREVMLAGENGRLNGLKGVAANLIRADKEHELAIEVALATHLQDVVAATAADARDAILYLKESGKGRATFLPLDQISPATLHPRLVGILNRPGVVGSAVNLVHYDKELEAAAQFLLGTTIVVENLDVGLGLVREGYRGRYVSLDGQLIHPSGAMTGGRVKTTGLMSREREIRELAKSVERLDAGQNELVGQIEKARATQQTEKERIGEMIEALDRLRLEQANRTKDHEAARHMLDQTETSLGQRRAQIGRIDEELAGKLESIAHWEGERTRGGESLTDAENRLSEAQQTNLSQGEDILQLGTSVAEARAEVEKARERMVEAEQRLNEFQRDLDAVGRQRQARAGEIDHLRVEDTLLAEQIDRIKREMESAIVELETLNRTLIEDQAARDEVTAKLKELTGEIERLTRDEKVLDNEVHEVELRQIEFKTHLSDLSEQCEEKFDRTLDQLAEELGEIDKDPHALQSEVAEMRRKLEAMGVVNLAALEEYEQQNERLVFLQAQHKDLSEAKADLIQTIQQLDETTRKLFQETFDAVRVHFIEMFRRLFNGGKADMMLDAPEGVDPLLEGGIEIVAQPPGKKLQSISLLSGGEKAMTAIALLFGLFLHKPSPFCILDEIDAPLDDVNVERFKQILREFNKSIQFAVITHNKLTMELADALYGVTMEESGVSKMVSVRFEQAEALVDAV